MKAALIVLGVLAFVGLTVLVGLVAAGQIVRTSAARPPRRTVQRPPSRWRVRPELVTGRSNPETTSADETRLERQRLADATQRRIIAQRSPLWTPIDRRRD